MGVCKFLIAKKDIKKGDVIAELWRSYHFDNVYDDKRIGDLSRKIVTRAGALQDSSGGEWEEIYNDLSSDIDLLISESEKRGAVKLLNYIKEEVDITDE